MQPITRFRLWYKGHERVKRAITIIKVIIIIIIILTPKILQHRWIIKTQLEVTPPRRDNNISQNRLSEIMEAKVAAGTAEADPAAMAEVGMAAEATEAAAMAAEAMAAAVTAAAIMEVDMAAGNTAAEILVVAVSQRAVDAQVLAGAEDVRGRDPSGNGGRRGYKRLD